MTNGRLFSQILERFRPIEAPPLDDHAISIEWLVEKIQLEGQPLPKPTLTPNQQLVHSLRGVEPRWWIILPTTTFAWLVFLYGIGFVADGLANHKFLRFGATLVLFIGMVFASREIGAKFRALNDRTGKSSEIAWGMTSGWFLIGTVLAVSDPIKKVLSENSKYDTLTSITLLAWIGLYGAILKFPWDRATELRKAAHSSWRTTIARWIRSVIRFSFKRGGVSGQRQLMLLHHQQLADWDQTYPGWRPQWQSVRTAGFLTSSPSDTSSFGPVRWRRSEA